MISNLIFLLLRIQSKKTRKEGLPIFYIKGNGKDYPRMLLYTENENVYQRMENF